MRHTKKGVQWQMERVLISLSLVCLFFPVFVSAQESLRSKDESLIEAAKKGDSQKVEQLISEGANIEARGERGTVLMHAAGNGHKEIVELLLSKGADVNAKNNHGATASMYAEKNGYREIVEMLKSKEKQAVF